MGDMADYFLEQVEDMECARQQYLHGLITDLEAMDLGVLDEQGVFHSASSGTPTTKTCKYCDKPGLTWGKHNGKWRLFEKGELHQCPVNPLRE